MKRILTLVLFGVAVAPLPSIAACEGEPPVMAPENPSGAGSAVAAALVPATAAEAPPAPAMTVCPPPTCAPVASATAVANASAAPAASSETPAEPVQPAPPKRGTISGTVTTQPPALAHVAIIYLESQPSDTNPSHQTVRIDNRQMTFIPYVAVVAVEGKVVFENTDPFPHNVFSPDNEKFNLGNIPQNGAVSRVFHHPGAYSLLCNLHPGMLGYLLVTPSTHFVRTDAKGKFSMRDVPVGTYDVSAWAPRQKPVTESVTVIEGDVIANFDMHR